MALTKKLEDFPGAKSFKAFYNSIPGSTLTKNIVTAVVAVVAVAVGVAALTAVGAVVGVLGAGLGALLAAPLLIKVGVLVTVAALFFAARTVIPILMNFDWNISDKKIDEKLKGALDNLYEPFGEFLGKSMGYLICGALPNAFTFVFSPMLAYSVLTNLGREAYEELMPQAANIARLASVSYGNAYALQQYKSIRKWIKRPGTPFHESIKNAIGAENFKRWGEDDNAPFILNKKIDEKIESIKDPKMKALAEGAWEGFREGCGEASVIFAHKLSDQIAATKLAMAKQRQRAVTVDI